MRVLAVLSALLLIAGCDESPFVSSGHYTIVAAGSRTMLLDNLDGRTWVLVDQPSSRITPTWIEVSRQKLLAGTESVTVRRLSDEVATMKRVEAEIARQKTAAAYPSNSN